MTKLSTDNYDTLYTIGETGWMFFSPEWFHSMPNCPTTYEVRRVLDDGSERELVDLELALLVLVSEYK